MKRIHFRKIEQYDPTFDGSFSRYEGYCMTTLQRKEPQILEGSPLSVNQVNSFCYCSPRLRAVQSAQRCYRNHKILDELNEVRFDLSALVNENEFSKYGSTLVREKFIESFINDSLLESSDSLKTRIDRLMVRLNKEDSEEVVCISHSFFMKIVEAYLKSEKRLFEDRKIIQKYLKPDKKTYPFSKGFIITLDQQN